MATPSEIMTDKVALLRLIEDARDARLVLPEFQRDFVWEPRQVCELMTSVFQGLYIGAFLALYDVRPQEAPFALRVVEGVKNINPDADFGTRGTLTVLLDGQQRLTSCLYALWAPPVGLKRKTPYRVYVNLEKVAAEEWDEDTVFHVGETDRRRSQEVRKGEQEGRVLWTSRLRTPDVFWPWFSEHRANWEGALAAAAERCARSLHGYAVAVVKLPCDGLSDEVVTVFERVNRTGTRLGTFDLAVARVFLSGVNLRALWREFLEKHPACNRVPLGRSERYDAVDPEAVLKTMALLQAVVPKRGETLRFLGRLSGPEVLKLWDTASELVAAAVDRLRSCETGYGVIHKRFLPYSSVLPLIAAALGEIERRGGDARLYRQLDRWYWAVTLGGMYDQGVDTQMHEHLRLLCGSDNKPGLFDGARVAEWISSTPERVDLEAAGPTSATYKAAMCLFALEGAHDLRTGQAVDLYTCTADHIFPKSLFGREPLCDTALNRTLLSKETNEEIKRAKRPSVFIAELLKRGNSREDLLRRFSTHLVTRRAFEALERDDFQGFVRERDRAIRQKIRERMRLA